MKKKMQWKVKLEESKEQESKALEIAKIRRKMD